MWCGRLRSHRIRATHWGLTQQQTSPPFRWALALAHLPLWHLNLLKWPYAHVMVYCTATVIDSDEVFTHPPVSARVNNWPVFADPVPSTTVPNSLYVPLVSDLE